MNKEISYKIQNEVQLYDRKLRNVGGRYNMSLPKCRYCSNEFTWKTIVKNLWWYKPILCDKCNTMHKITFPSRILLSWVTLSPVYVFIYFYCENFIPYFNTISFAGIYAILVAVIIMWSTISNLIAPFYVKYKITT